MREPANKRMLTDVSGLRSHRCTIIASTLSPQRGESRGCGASVLDKGHKRMRSLGNRNEDCAAKLAIFTPSPVTQASSIASFDHLVGECEQRRRDVDAERSRRLQVDDQFEL